MMLHRDHNYHDSQGKAKTDIPINRDTGKQDFISPEVPFRIKAIYDYLSQEPQSDPLLG